MKSVTSCPLGISNDLNSPNESYSNTDYLSKSADMNEKRLDSFMSRFRYRRTGSEDSVNNAFEQAFIMSIYNAIAIVILAACIALCVILLILLQPFIRPIFWALLTSAVLFSSKRYWTKMARTRLSNIEKRNAFLFFELVFSPFEFIDFLVELIYSFLKLRFFHLLALVGSIFSVNLVNSFYGYLFSCSIVLFEKIINVANSMAYYSDNSWQLTCALIVAYLLGISFYWHESSSILFQILSLPVWLSVLFHVSTLMGAYRPFFLLFFVFVACLGFVSLINEFLSQMFLHEENESENENMSDASLNESTQEARPETASALELSKEKLWHLLEKFFRLYLSMFTKSKPKAPEARKSSNLNRSGNKKRTNSDKYFFILFWLFIAVTLRIDMYIVIPVIVVVWKLIKLAFIFAYNFITEGKQIEKYRNLIVDWTKKRASALMPKPFTILLTVFSKGNYFRITCIFLEG